MRSARTRSKCRCWPSAFSNTIGHWPSIISLPFRLPFVNECPATRLSVWRSSSPGVQRPAAAGRLSCRFLPCRRIINQIVRPSPSSAVISKTIVIDELLCSLNHGFASCPRAISYTKKGSGSFSLSLAGEAVERFRLVIVYIKHGQ